MTFYAFAFHTFDHNINNIVMVYQNILLVFLHFY